MRFIVITLLVTRLWFTSGAQQKPTSTDYTKVKIAENGHKDSVIDNRTRLYNASIPEPCLKCVVQTIRRTDRVKQYVSSVDSAKIVYEVDWYSAKQEDVGKKLGSGLLINVYKNLPKSRITLAAYIYDNVSGELYYINSRNGNQSENVKLDSIDHIKIRNACFWGVASKK